MLIIRALRHSALTISLSAGLLGGASVSAQTTLLTIGGKANPFLAGAPGGTACCGGDSSPAESPTTLAQSFAPGSTFTFAAAGVTDGAGTGPTGPDGAYVFSMGDFGTGIAGAYNVRVLGLVGVFLSSATPTAALQPSRLDFSTGLNFTTLAPGLAQIFWIGDGLTGTGAGVSQVFTAPTGATRLFLGTVDGSEWNNNSGSYAVTVNFTPGAGVVPEPASWAMMIAGFGLIGGARRRRVLSGQRGSC